MTLPAAPGIGFKPVHFADIRNTQPDLGFFEIHAENYMGDGGAPHAMLAELSEKYAISLHGVGLSIGGSDPLDRAHLDRLADLCERYKPAQFSEHLAWSSHGNEFLNDLLPVPYTPETLDRICQHVDQVQNRLGRRMLLENPSTYVIFEQSTIAETDFMSEIARRTGCGLLLDVNNVFVSCTNHRADPVAYLEAFPLEIVGEVHLGGFDAEELPDGPLLIDSHGKEVADPVWALYDRLMAKTGPLPTLIEWDNDVPEFDVLMAEADRARVIMDRALPREQRHAIAS